MKEDIEPIILHNFKNPLTVTIAAAKTIKEEGKYSEQNIELATDSAYSLKHIIDELKTAPNTNHNVEY